MDAGPCIVWIAGAAGDYASTRAALGRDMRAVEGNPIQGQGALRQAAIQAGSAAVGCWADHKLRSKGKRGWARGLRIAVFALKIGLVANNLGVGRKGK